MRRLRLPCRAPSLAAALAIGVGAGISAVAWAADALPPDGGMGAVHVAGGAVGGGVGYLATRAFSLLDRWTRLAEEVGADWRAGKLALPRLRVDHHLHDGASNE